jgi:uncharacterized membrane protein
MASNPPRCPVCGEQVDSGASTEHEILHSIDHLTRKMGKATTQAIASGIYLSSSQTWRYLKRLEQEGQIQRIGERGGWNRAA